jgi:hypothetical protein
MQGALAGLRQLRFPAALRIAAAPWPPGWEGALTEALAARSAPASAPAPVTEAPDAEPAWLSDLGTGLWRLKQRMLEPGTDRPLEEMRRAYRHLESVMDVAREAGLEIQDHTGTPYHSGMSLRVLAFQPTPGVQRDKVGETIKPTIYLNGTMIQMGEVIVSTPEAST